MSPYVIVAGLAACALVSGCEDRRPALKSRDCHVRLQSPQGGEILVRTLRDPAFAVISPSTRWWPPRESGPIDLVLSYTAVPLDRISTPSSGHFAYRAASDGAVTDVTFVVNPDGAPTWSYAGARLGDHVDPATKKHDPVVLFDGENPADAELIEFLGQGRRFEVAVKRGDRTLQTQAFDLSGGAARNEMIGKAAAMIAASDPSVCRN
jgi:hypothetical protein